MWEKKTFLSIEIEVKMFTPRRGCKRELCYLHFLSIFFSASVYDDIIKLTIEHLTFTLAHWNSSWCFLANRKINIHSCIQRTWLLLCEFHTILLFFLVSVESRGWKAKLFFFCHSELYSALLHPSPPPLSNIILFTSFIFNWSRCRALLKSFTFSNAAKRQLRHMAVSAIFLAALKSTNFSR